MMPKPKPSVEKLITSRFLEVMADHVGIAKKWRYKNGFAKSMGMVPQEVVKIEKGSNVQLRHLVSIQAFTGVNLNWLIAGVGEKYDVEKSSLFTDHETRISNLEKAILRK